MADELQTLAAEPLSTDEGPASQQELATDQTQLAGASGPSTGTGTTGPGTVVGRYVIIEEVGRGAMGVVYSAYDPKLDRKVAIKLLIADERGRRSLGEAQALAKLNHPNVVQVYDAGEHGERVFMAMEFVIGQPLGRWRERVQPSREAVLDVFRRAAQGLAAAHEAGLVHRDFKPDNVMIAEDERVLVMDFGLAIAEREQDTGRGKFWASGTPAYMSPEQFANDPVGPPSDQFSFFVALYEALAGERPFASDNNLASLALAVSEGKLRHDPPLRGQPSWLRRLVLRGLEVDPKARHPSMQAVAEQLEAGLGRRGRRIGVAVGGLAIVAGLAGWVFESKREDPAAAACRADAQVLGEQWTAGWHEQAKASFEAKLGDDGARLWRRVEGEVDEFAAAWASSYDQACSARFVAGSLEAGAFRQRLRCLDDQREYTTSLLAKLARADGEALREIAAVSSELPRPASCKEDEHAVGDFNADQQELVAEARRGLMSAVGRAHAGDREEARTIAVAALESLAEVDAPVTRAELLSLIAQLDYEVGDLERGRSGQLAGVESAARSGDARLLAEAWVTRVEQLVSSERDLESAAILLEAVEVAVAAVPDDAELRARLASLRGIIALRTGQTRAARDAFELALSIAEEAELGPRMLEVQVRRLGAAESMLGEVAEAREHFERAAQLASSLYGERHDRVVGAHTNLGLLCRQEGDRGCEREHLQRAIALADSPGPRAQNLVLLGQLEYDERDLDEAERLANEAVELYEGALGELHAELTAPRLLLSNILRRRGDADGALEQAERLLAIAEASASEGDPKRSLALANLGEALRNKEQLAEALDAHERALAMRRETLEDEDPRVAYSLVQTAEVLRLLDRRERAAGLAREAIDKLESAPGTERWRADARFILAQVLEPAEASEARALAGQALDIYESLGEGSATSAKHVRAWLEDH